MSMFIIPVSKKTPGRSKRGKLFYTDGSSTSGHRHQNIIHDIKQESLSKLPKVARLPCTDITVKVNTKSEKREVTSKAEKPPESPQILVLSDDMMAHFKRPDKYMKCFAMFGYDWNQYTRDVEEDLIDVDLPYCILYLDTMQLGVYNARKTHTEMGNLIQAIVKRNSHVTILVSGIIPRPVDHKVSQRPCESANTSMRLIVQDIAEKFKVNLKYIDVYLEYLNLDGTIKRVKDNFREDIYLTEIGIRIIRAAWLRELGFFPKK